MCTVLLPLGVNPIAVNKYINMNLAFALLRGRRKKRGPVRIAGVLTEI
jgi:hypothetical protein